MCTVVGAVLAATDPVAVVALLQSVGASPFLTMQITGESLMNDGTAIVLFNIFWAKYQGIHTYRYEDFGAMVKYFLRMSVAGPLLGIAIGFVALRLLKMADRRYSKQDSTMQTSITVCTAVRINIYESCLSSPPYHSHCSLIIYLLSRAISI